MPHRRSLCDSVISGPRSRRPECGTESARFVVVPCYFTPLLRLCPFRMRQCKNAVSCMHTCALGRRMVTPKGPILGPFFPMTRAWDAIPVTVYRHGHAMDTTNTSLFLTGNKKAASRVERNKRWCNKHDGCPLETLAISEAVTGHCSEAWAGYCRRNAISCTTTVFSLAYFACFALSSRLYLNPKGPNVPMSSPAGASLMPFPSETPPKFPPFPVRLVTYPWEGNTCT